MLSLTIMAAIAFGIPMNFDNCYLEGISQLEGKDIQYAEELGYRVKLLGLTRRTAASSASLFRSAIPVRSVPVRVVSPS